MTVVLAFRHGLVENPEGVIYARLPGFHLSEQGREEAARLGGLLSRADVSAVYSSPLERAVETAGELAAPHGAQVTVDDRLIEWAFWTTWAGTPWQGLPDREPQVAAYVDDPSAACPEEPLEQVGKRVLSWAEEAAEAHHGVVFGVSHEAPLAAAYVVGAGAEWSGFRAVHIPHLSALRLVPGPPELVDPVAALSRC